MNIHKYHQILESINIHSSIFQGFPSNMMDDHIPFIPCNGKPWHLQVVAIHFQVPVAVASSIANNVLITHINLTST
jgi:hypothetical protein